MDATITSPEQLRAHYREPGQGALRKQLDQLDAHCRDFIAHSPLLMLATADASGRCDVSPKGGPAGFVAVLDDRRLAIPDLSGNNRLDSMSNLVTSPGIGLLFLIPGVDETLRVNGHGQVTTAEDIRQVCALDGTVPNVAVVVTVEEVYIHCAKAFRRSGAWQPQQWPDTTGMASVPCMVRDHVKADDVPVDAVAAALERDYKETLWRPGGREEG